MRLFGPVFPVATSVGDNLWLHRGLAEAENGMVLVVSILPPGREEPDSERPATGQEFGYWGELMTHAAIARGIHGLLIDGHVRDREAIVECEFPVFSRGVCLRGTKKSPLSPGSLLRSVEIGGVAISEGDLVVGDADGVVVVSGAEIPAVLDRAGRIAQEEREFLERIRAGESTLQIFGLKPT